jgi:photosystem II stability/assembly factor-like uncharacterized protein
MKRCLILFLYILAGSYHAPAQKENERENIEGRMQYRFQMRANQNGEIPVNALMDAKVKLDLKRQLVKGTVRGAMDAGIGGWEWLGPGNIGGRVRAIVFHPLNHGTLFIGGASGGIWRTDNSGGWWYPLTDFMANNNVTSIVIDPTNASIMYAATGEENNGAGGPGTEGNVPGDGIFKSVDGGATWTQLESTRIPGFSFVGRLAHHPSISNTLLAAAGGGVYRTTDGGGSWTSTLSGVIGFQVKYHPTNPSRVLCGTHTDFYLSTDGGLSWTRQTTGAANKLPDANVRCEGDFSVTDNDVYVNMVNNDSGQVWRSTDAGVNWSLRKTRIQFGFQGDYNNTMWVDPTNSSIILAGGRNLQRSTDGGSTFMKIGGDASGVLVPNVHCDVHVVVQHPAYNGSSIKTVYVGCDGGVYRADDIRSASTSSGWTYLNSNLGITQFYGGAVSLDGSLIAGAAQDNDRSHTTPGRGPQNWFGAGGNAKGGDGTAVAIDPGNAARVYAAATYGLIGRSDDSGHTYFQKINGLADSSSLFVAPLVMDPNNSSTLYWGGTRLWKTTDRAENWSQFRPTVVTSPNCSALAVAGGNPNIIWAGYVNGQLSRTTDGGAHWTDFPGGGRPTTAVTSIAISPSSNSVVLVSYGGYTVGTVWLTEDGGNTWSGRSGTAPDDLPAIQVNTLSFHPLNSNWMYAGTDLGVFASENRGLSWSFTALYGWNEGPVNVEVSQLFWQGSDYLMAATYGRGMFRSRIRFAIYVDQSNPLAGDGTLGNPYRLIQDGANVQGNGTDLYVKTGIYTQGGIILTRRGWIVPWGGSVEIR